MVTETMKSTVGSLLAAGLTLRDVAERLGAHENTIAAVCLCRHSADVRHEHPQCPKHVLDVQRRMRAASAEARSGPSL